jgi:uncharacterized protein (TIGR03032 family)
MSRAPRQAGGRRPARPAAARRSARAQWARHAAEWRDPAQVAGSWREAAETDPGLLRAAARGAWWELLAGLKITLLVTREYEHLVMAARADARPELSYFRLPHPSGLAVDRARGLVHVASTRNPNVIYDLSPVDGLLPPLAMETGLVEDRPLVPVASRFYPGSLYLHDLAYIGPDLHANAVGQNAVVRLDEAGGYRRVWWPRCIETDDGPVFARNHLQLNSIAAGADPAGSYYSASSDRISARRPGHGNFPVDGRGVVFSGATREPIARGLTRPHSARLRGRDVWVDNSGYGEVGIVADGRFQTVVRLPGWTRGLCFCEDVAFVGTSRVIPRFRQYAPGLDVNQSVCGVHAVDARSGRVLGSLRWPSGNQIFAVDWLPARQSGGFPFRATGSRATARPRRIFYAFVTEGRRP